MSGRTFVAGLLVVIIGGFALIALRGGRPRAAPRGAPVATEAELRREREADRREATVAFTDPVPPAPEEAAEFARLFAAFTAAVEKEDGPGLADLFDPGRVFDELVRQSAGRGPFRAGNQDSFLRGFRNGAGNVVFNPLFRWDRVEVRRVRWSPYRGEAVVVAVHRRDLGAETLSLKVRWWLVRRPGGWRVFDFEDLDGGLRLTAVIANLAASPDNLARLPKLRETMVALREAQTALLAEDVAALDAALARCRGADLPAPFAAVVAMLEAAADLARGDPAAALKALDRAEALNPDMPCAPLVRAMCLNASGDHGAALAAADAYIAQLGADGEAAFQRGLALEGLNRVAEAVAAYRQSLDDTPGSADTLDGLRRLLPDDKKDELGDRLARAADPGALFDEATRLARVGEDEPAALAYEAGLRKARPGDPRGIAPGIRRQVAAGKFAEAAAELRAGLDRVSTDADRRRVIDAYLFAMLSADRPGEAYAAVPGDRAAAAFRLLAGELEGSLADEDPDAPKYRKQLRELIAARRKDAAADPWVGFYEAALLQEAKEYGKAERAFAAAQALFEKAVGPPGDEPDADADQFRTRRVECLYALKQGLRAYAEVGLPADTFRQLAHAYEGDKDTDGLRQLVAAHRKAAPDDPGVTFWLAQLSYLKEEYADAAGGFQAFLRAADPKSHDRWRATDRCVRSYLRAEKPADAGRVVADAGPNGVVASLRAAVALAAGRADEADEILAGLAGKPGGPVFVYHDEDFARLIARPAFADLRLKYPDPRPAGPGS